MTDFFRSRDFSMAEEYKKFMTMPDTIAVDNLRSFYDRVIVLVDYGDSISYELAIVEKDIHKDTACGMVQAVLEDFCPVRSVTFVCKLGPVS